MILVERDQKHRFVETHRFGPQPQKQTIYTFKILTANFKFIVLFNLYHLQQPRNPSTDIVLAVSWSKVEGSRLQSTD